LLSYFRLLSFSISRFSPQLIFIHPFFPTIFDLSPRYAGLYHYITPPFLQSHISLSISRRFLSLLPSCLSSYPSSSRSLLTVSFSPCHFLLRSRSFSPSAARVQHYPWFPSHTLLIHTLLPPLSSPYLTYPPSHSHASPSISFTLFLPVQSLSLPLSYLTVPSRLAITLVLLFGISRRFISPFCLPLLLSRRPTETERAAVVGGDEREQIGGGYRRCARGCKEQGVAKRA